MSTETTPEFRFLSDDGNRAFLISLRKSVAPILANNLLHHFTDHSVTHSDRLTSNVDQLIQPIQSSANKLSSDELVILYAGCYLHDIGMQYENIGSTNTIVGLSLSTPWEDLSEEGRRSLLREHHHLISAELALQASEPSDPLIGIHIQKSYHPDCIAAICEAQNVDVGSIRHEELTQEVAGIRVFLLSGLLRLADILDESRVRAEKTKGKTLLLDICSQSHWWRHYYTENVTFDQTDKVIYLHFDFPKGREKEYQAIVPQLQLPWIQEELAKHARVFNQVGLGWSVDFKAPNKTYSSAEIMPLEVQSEMLKKLHARKEKDAENQRNAVLDSFEEAQPYFNQRMDELQEKCDSLHPKDHLLAIESIAKEMWQLGARRSALMLLSSEFDKSGSLLASKKQLELGIWISNGMLEDNRPKDALRTMQTLNGLVDHLPDSDPTKSIYFILFSKIMIENCSYLEAVAVIEAAINITGEASACELNAMLSELHLLHGNLEQVLKAAPESGATK